jgi:type IV pilus assembly protein PilC
MAGIDIKTIKKTQNASKKNKGKDISWVWSFLNKDISFGRKGISDKKKEEFYTELGILLTSGIDIKTSLEIIIEEQKKGKEKNIYQDIYEKVVGGESLSEAMRITGKFTNYEYYSLKIGEESGKVNDVLKELTTYFNKKIQQRRQLSGALTYPVMVLITALAAVFFMMKFIVPMFTDVFKRFGGELPSLTKFIINLSNTFSGNIGYFLFLVIALFILRAMVKKKKWYRAFASGLQLRLPVFGEVIKKIYIARFCQSMALLIGARTPILKAIQLTGNMISFYPYEKAMAKIEQDILYGKLLHQSMAQFTIFDKRLLALTKVGEEVNQLDKIFTSLNNQYSAELEHRISVLGNLLEPLMIIFVAVIVAVILIAMYMPLFQLSTSIL